MGGYITALLQDLKKRVRKALDPEATGGAEARRLFADEARASNARVLQLLPLVLVPLSAIAIVVIARRPETGAADVAWQRNTIELAMTHGLLCALGAFVAWRGRPKALFRVLGDVWGPLGILTSAAMSANAQRAHPNLNVFVIAAFGAAFFLRTTPRIFALALAGGVALVVSGIETFRVDASGRRADELAVTVAPEQVAKPGAAAAPADVYALGWISRRASPTSTLRANSTPAEAGGALARGPGEQGPEGRVSSRTRSSPRS